MIIIFVTFIILILISIITCHKVIRGNINIIVKNKIKNDLMKNNFNNSSKKINKKRIKTHGSIEIISKSSNKNTNVEPPKKNYNKIDKNKKIIKEDSQYGTGNIYQSNVYFNLNKIKSNKTLKSKNSQTLPGGLHHKQKKNKKSKKKDFFKKSKFLNFKSEKKVSQYNENKYKNLNDKELNSLEYELALQYDKRTFFQYYWSLIKRKQLILFSFCPNNDYNIMTIKTSLFFVSFSLYFSINGFFFNDNTMHKFYKDKGKINFVYQIPQILYSTMISAVIHMILKTLSLSENNILELKQIVDRKNIIDKSKEVEFRLKIKLLIFFLLSSSIMIFLCYFISCFCAVYTNTQMILIEDTLISFALSMAYPFGLNLIPTIFRISSLRAKNKDKSCMYKTSSVIALI